MNGPVSHINEKDLENIKLEHGGNVKKDLKILKVTIYKATRCTFFFGGSIIRT